MRVNVYISLVFGLFGSSIAQICPSGSRVFSRDVCLTLQDTTADFTTAQTACQRFNGGNLATVNTAGGLYTLRNYVTALGTEDAYYWIGYQYNNQQLQTFNGSDANTLIINDITDNGVSGNTGVCLALGTNGDLVNTNCDEALGYVCLYMLTDPIVAQLTVNDSFINRDFPLGESLIIECFFGDTDTSSDIQWTLNGSPISDDNITIGIEPDGSTSRLNLLPFLMAGVYQCSVTNTDGRSASRFVELYGDFDVVSPPPGRVQSIVVLPNTKTSLFIQWQQPSPTFVVSPLLVTYTLYYSTVPAINYTTSPSVTGLKVEDNGIGTYLLEELNVHSVYYLGMIAENRAGSGPKPNSVAISITYGNAPSMAPENLKLNRSEENDALLAYWNSVETSSPEGQLSFYRVEFRDMRSNSDESNEPTTIFISPAANISSIFNVRNAQSYEVRVAAAVQVKRTPREYEYSPFTEWVGVTGISDEIPSNVPTIRPQPVSDGENNMTPILVGVLVPAAVVITVGIIIGIILVIYFNIKDDKDEEANDYPDAGKMIPPEATNPHDKSPSDDMEMGSVQPSGENIYENDQ